MLGVPGAVHVTCDAASSISRRSSESSARAAAPMFSSSRCRFVVLGSERSTASGPEATRGRSARASPSSPPRSLATTSTNVRFAFRFSGVSAAGCCGSRSCRTWCSRRAFREKAPPERAERNEADSQLFERRQRLGLGALHHSENSLWSAVTGWTRCARESFARRLRRARSA